MAGHDCNAVLGHSDVKYGCTEDTVATEQYKAMSPNFRQRVSSVWLGVGDMSYLSYWEILQHVRIGTELIIVRHKHLCTSTTDGRQ